MVKGVIFRRIFWICTGISFFKSAFGLISEHLDTLHAKLFKGTGFKNKTKREEIEARKKRWVFQMEWENM